MKNKITMTVDMEVTEAQALTLQAMFEEWNSLANMGSSQKVTLYADGDGDFRPNCHITTDAAIQPLTDELRKLAKAKGYYDHDAVAWKIEED